MAQHAAKVLFPANMNEMAPITVVDERLSMTAAFVGRYALDALPQEWRKLGINGFYILLSEIRADYSFEAYVGQTRTLFERRLNSHDEKKEFWQQAILFTKFGEYGLTSTQVNWLEGELVRLLRQGRHIKVHNLAWTGDTSLPVEDEMLVEDISLFVMRVLFLRGYRSESLGNEVRKLEVSVQGRNEFEGQHSGMNQQIAAAGQASVALTAASDIVPGDEWETLRRWRWRMKTEAKLYKAYHVFNDAQLRQLQEVGAQRLEDFRGIDGIAWGKVQTFGPSLLATLRLYKEHMRVQPTAVVELPQVHQQPRRLFRLK